MTFRTFIRSPPASATGVLRTGVLRTGASAVGASATGALPTFLVVVLKLVVCGIGFMGFACCCAEAQDSLAAIGNVVSRTALPVKCHLDHHQYHPLSDAWYPEGRQPSHTEDDRSVAKVSNAKDVKPFDATQWRLQGQDPPCGLSASSSSGQEDVFVSIQDDSKVFREPRIYVRPSGQDGFRFVCRGTQPCSGNRFFEPSAQLTFCYLDGAKASVWDNEACRVLDSDVDAITWTRDRRHIVYARRNEGGDQLIAYSLADDAYFVLVSLPNAAERPLLFPAKSDGVYVVTLGTDLRAVSLPPAATVPKFDRLNQIPLLYRSVDHGIVAVADSKNAADPQKDSKHVRIIERSREDASQVEVRVAIP